MSFKDDFLEALRSVKRDFFGDSAQNETQQAQSPAQEEPLAESSVDSVTQEPVAAAPESSVPGTEAEATQNVAPSTDTESEYASSQQPDEVVYEAFKQASTIDESGFQEPEDGFFDRIAAGAESLDEDDEDNLAGDTTPYREFDPTPLVDNFVPSFDGGDNGGRYADDFESESFGSDKTIISKNTIINGSVSTDDSLRLLGQVLGDIDCRSNIVVAGKIRGNTSAANAYIFDAQVDGDLRCDDTVNISNDAWILGNIRAQQADIDGKIKGNIEIRHMVSIGPSSSVLGDISADELEIKRGAFVNGQVMMYSPSRDVLDRFDNFED